LSLKASEYFQALLDLALATQVTGENGLTMTLDQGAEAAIEMLLDVRKESRKVMLVGNGGSAALVSHMQNDICKAVDTKGLVFTEQPLMMALSNDEGYDVVFERPIRLWADPGDLLIAVSSSGKSPNILKGTQAAAEIGCRIMTLTGFGADNPLRKMGQLNFYVASNVYGYVETAHAALTHFVTDRAKDVAQNKPKVQSAV
jgi:D-sedoheptulose 7-phosphate isomerase